MVSPSFHSTKSNTLDTKENDLNNDFTWFSRDNYEDALAYNMGTYVARNTLEWRSEGC